MRDRAFSYLLKTAFALVALLLVAGIWYYTMGRKPKLALSVPISDKMESPSVHAVGAGEVLLVTGGKAALYATAGGAARWSVALGTPAPIATPKIAPKVSPAPVAEEPVARRKLPELSTGEKADQLLAKRGERRFAKLREWSGKLNAKKTKLKTTLQIEAFNEEAKKYHAELTEARTEAALAQKQTVAAPHRASSPEDAENEDPAFARGFGRFDSLDEKTDVLADGGTLLLLHGLRARLLDRASGMVKKEVPLPGNFTRVLHGPSCAYAISTAPDDARQVTRIATTDGAAQTVKIVGPRSEGRFHLKEAGVPAEPVTQPLRTELSANGGVLLRCDVRLVEKKITERVLAAAADASSALEEADRKSATAWGSDVANYAQALAADSSQEDSGGRERTDESTYEVLLTRPLDPAIPEVRATVRGHTDIFSSRTLALVTAGRTLLAFDHSNRKLWETTLAAPVADPGSARDDDDAATVAQPCLEDGGRIYFFDTAFLTAFDAATGQPAWRVPTAGIRKLQHDGRGALYVSTGGGEDFTTGAAEPQTLKIDAKSGKIVWKVAKYQDCFIAAGRVYATRETRNSEDMVNAVFDRSKAIQCRWKIYKLTAGTGEPQWEWFQTRRPLSVDAEGRKVTLLFAEELQVIQSIAL